MKRPTPRLNELIIKYSDLLLAGGVVMILMLLVVRIDAVIMDVLIAVNIGVGALILLTALYIHDASKLPSFPTILLLSTLFRLGLNVSTTRLILLEADAGDIINAFGQFVVQGNFVVGGIVFIVLVLIQFIVIAKGSERVAEVSARFTLDAMPGKQMAIDADMRNGLISPEQGRQRRRELERESKLYGAMDGAMKFVKGDAIAGIIISLVNIVGGLIVGVMQQGMAAGEAAEIYSLLTIGDGLVSQIPALLISVSAGLVVTRVAGGDEPTGNVGRDIVGQMLGKPKALIVVAVLMVGAGASSPWTGFPMIPFIALGAMATAVAVPGLTKQMNRQPGDRGGDPQVGGAEDEVGEHGAEQGKAQDPAPRRQAPLPLALDLHPSLERVMVPADEAQRQAIHAELQQIRQSLSHVMGVPLPAIVFRMGDPTLRVNSYAVSIHDSPVEGGSIAPSMALVLCSPQDAAERGLEAMPAQLPWNGAPVSMIAIDDVDKARAADLPVMTPARVILTHLRVALRRRASEFVGIQETAELIEELKESCNELVTSVVPRLLTQQQIAEVLRRLAREQVPIRHLKLIIESLAQWSQNEKDPSRLTELVRRDLRRVLCNRFAVGHRLMHYFTLDPRVEALIEESAMQTAQGIVCAMSGQDRRAIIETVRAAVAEYACGSEQHVILTTSNVRRLFRVLIEDELPDVAVLAYEEVAPEMNAMAVGHVGWPGDEAEEEGEMAGAAG